MVDRAGFEPAYACTGRFTVELDNVPANALGFPMLNQYSGLACHAQSSVSRYFPLVPSNSLRDYTKITPVQRPVENAREPKRSR